MLPQWPRVVSATMLQFPSNLAAIAGGAEQMIAEAADRTMVHIRLPIMGILIRVLSCSSIRAVPMVGPVETLNAAACPNHH